MSTTKTIVLLCFLAAARLAPCQEPEAVQPRPTPPPGPVFEPRGFAGTLQQNRATLPLAAEAGPEFVPSTASLLSALVASKQNGTTLTVMASPFRLISLDKGRSLWGVQFQGDYSSDTKATTFSLAYRGEWRWILEKAWSKQSAARREERPCVPTGAGANQAAAKDTSQQDQYPACMKALDTMRISLLPVPTLGYQIGFFPATAGAEEQHSVSRELFTAKLSWRYGTYVEFEATAARGHQRNDNLSGLASTFSASAVAVYIIPRAFGIEHYDHASKDSFQKTVYQRGLGVGVSWSYQRCYEGEATYLSCPKQNLKETLIGGVVDLRISDKLAPRFSLGRREFTQYNSKSGATEAGAQLSFSMK